MMATCHEPSCKREARCAVRVRRPQRDNVVVELFTDDRADKVPAAALRYCKEHGLVTARQAAEVCIDEDGA